MKDLDLFRAEISAARWKFIADGCQDRGTLVDDVIDICERYFGDSPDWPIHHSQILDAAEQLPETD